MGAKSRAFLAEPTVEERVRAMPCCVCRRSVGHVYGPSEAHHYPTRGAGNHTQVVALCRYHHEEFHRIGQRSWQAKHGINLADEVERVKAALK